MAYVVCTWQDRRHQSMNIPRSMSTEAFYSRFADLCLALLWLALTTGRYVFLSSYLIRPENTPPPPLTIPLTERIRVALDTHWKWLLATIQPKSNILRMHPFLKTISIHFSNWLFCATCTVSTLMWPMQESGVFADWKTKEKKKRPKQQQQQQQQQQQPTTTTNVL